MKTLAKLLILNLIIALPGCSNNPNDPLEPFNRTMFSFNETLDHYLMVPIAKGYAFITPKEIRSMITHFFINLEEPVHAVNDLLQFKFTKAIDDTERFVYNSTFGVFGFFDIAGETLGLPLRQQSLAMTFSYYTNNSPSTYIVLPFFGSSTLRNSLADAITAVVSTNVKQVEIDDKSNRTINYSFNPYSFLKQVNSRANMLKYTQLMELQLDPYIAVKQHYLNQNNQLFRELNAK